MFNSDRQPPRRPSPRPASRPTPRSHRPAGPATIPPAEPRSPGHRRQLLKAAYHRLGVTAGVPVAQLVAADPDALMALAATAPPDRRGEARRLAMKVLRTRY